MTILGRGMSAVLLVTALAGLTLIPHLNGEGFVQSRGGYWTLHRQDSAALPAIAEEHASPSISTSFAYYLDISLVEADIVVAPDGLADPAMVRGFSRAELVVETYDPTLSAEEARRLDRMAITARGTLGSGVLYRVLAPPADWDAPRRVRIMTTDQVRFLIPEPTLIGLDVDWTDHE